MNKQESQQHRIGVLSALAAFTFWGVVPIYFKWLESVDAAEIIAHRIIWAIPVLILFLMVRDGLGFWRRLKLPLKTIGGLMLSGAMVAFNWLVFVWAVGHEQVLSTSLGYFINPLVNVLFGFLFLSEKLTRLQTLAVAIAAVGTAYLAWFLGQPPWVALMLAFSFGAYGLLRKKIGVGPIVGLLWEAILLLIPFALYLYFRAQQGELNFTLASTEIRILLLLSGVVTILPLIWFNMAAQRLSLSLVGFFQYLAPTISFLLAVFLFGEKFTQGHAVAFICIWLALLMISLEPVFRARKIRMPH